MVFFDEKNSQTFSPNLKINSPESIYILYGHIIQMLKPPSENHWFCFFSSLLSLYWKKTIIIEKMALSENLIFKTLANDSTDLSTFFIFYKRWCPVYFD